MQKKRKIIIFTDLDGTLLDFITYSYQTALPLIKLLKNKKIPIVFCTAKTRVENEYYQKKLKIADPFIVENGGAIFIPKNYFSFSYPYQKSFRKYFIIQLGAFYKKIRIALKKIRKKTGFKIRGFGDMTIKEVAKDTRLPTKLAKLAKKKEYNESFKFNESFKKEKNLFKEAKKLGFKISHGGRYYNIFGQKTDKGKAVQILTNLFKKEFGKIETIGLGDSLNDLPMLKKVDLAILVQKPSKTWKPKIKLKTLIKIKAVGPRGWIKAIKTYVLKT